VGKVRWRRWDLAIFEYLHQRVREVPGDLWMKLQLFFDIVEYIL
jgi:hypothetical protein